MKLALDCIASDWVYGIGPAATHSGLADAHCQAELDYGAALDLACAPRHHATRVGGKRRRPVPPVCQPDARRRARRSGSVGRANHKCSLRLAVSCRHVVVDSDCLRRMGCAGAVASRGQCACTHCTRACAAALQPRYDHGGDGPFADELGFFQRNARDSRSAPLRPSTGFGDTSRGFLRGIRQDINAIAASYRLILKWHVPPHSGPKRAD